MGAIKDGLNVLAFGFTLIFAASVWEGGFFNPPRTAPLGFHEITRGFFPESRPIPHRKNSKKDSPKRPVSSAAAVE